MSTNSLDHAITLIKQGKPLEAQKLLKPLIAEDHHNLPAWFWFIETCSTNKQRLSVLEICLEYNPDNEQVKRALEKLRALPSDQLPAQSPKSQNGHSLEISQGKYKPLIKLSIISAIIVAGINVLIYLLALLSNSVALYFILLFVMSAVPLLSSSVATAIVYSIYQSRYKGSILPIFRFGIPIILNLVGGYSVIIYLQARDLQSSISKFNHYHDVTISIKSETIVPWRPGTGYNVVYPYAYKAVIHVNNPLQEEIPQIVFSLGAYNALEYKNELYYDSRYIAHDYSNSIPPGDSDIVVELSIEKHRLECDNANLAKPLYLLYSIDKSPPVTVKVSNSINQNLLKIACNSTP